MNRELVGVKVSKSWDEITQDLREIYESSVRDNFQYLRQSDGGHISGTYHTFWDIGSRLIDYCIDDEYERMTDMVDDFGGLGWNVAYLVNHYNDSGLHDEECVWLGHEGKYAAQADKIGFKPSEKLVSKSCIKECSEEDLIVPFYRYKESQARYFAKLREYGDMDSIMKIMQGGNR